MELVHSFHIRGQVNRWAPREEENPAWLCKEHTISWGLSAYQNHIKNILEDPLYPLPQS